MAKAKCWPYEMVGHRYRPLDGMNGVVMRLFCPRCGRVIYANGSVIGMVMADDLTPEIAAALSRDEPVH